jgi:hypothetical protein
MAASAATAATAVPARAVTGYTIFGTGSMCLEADRGPDFA